MSGSRRAFFEKMVTAGFGAAAATVLTGYAPRGSGKGMHGPVRPATEVLKRPPATWARALVAPYHDGRPLSDQWAIAYIAEGREDQLVFVLVDLQTGGHAELDLWRRGGSTRPLSGTRRYDLHARGQAPRHLQRLADRLAGVIGRNERSVSPPKTVPSRPAPGERTA